MNLKSWVVKNSSGDTPLHDTVSNGHHDRIPKELFKPQYFLVLNWFGTTPLHLAMSPGKVKYLPTELIMGRAILNLFSANHAQSLSAGYFSRLFKNPQLNILVPDCRGITPLHIAAEKGCLNELPEECLQPRYMMTKALNGITPLHIAAKYGCLNELPEECLQPRYMMTKARNGYTPMHYAMGTISGTIPNSCFSKESLTMLVKDNHGDTPLHTAARWGRLAQLPKHLLMQETMLVKNSCGNTPFHYAACFGHLYQLPKELLTPKTMLIQDKHGVTPLHRAVMEGHLDLLLGIDFGDSEEIKEAVGEEWWVKNLGIVRQKKGLEFGDTAPEIDLF